MKALTIWQPWASLIIAGAKPYEFRSWSPPRWMIGQRIVIHAAARKIDTMEAAQMYHLLKHMGGSQGAKELCLKAELALPVLEAVRDGSLPIGAGLGSATVGEARLGTHIAEDFGVPRANDRDRDEHANWGWPMLDIEPWADPIPCKGAQGLWNWPDATSFAETL